MGLLQKAVETYDAFAALAGVEVAEQVTLEPISHQLATANIEIKLYADGKFHSARAVGGGEPKIAIPVTEKSGGRTSNVCPHPLCEQLAYLVDDDAKQSTGKHQNKKKSKYDLYVEQLSAWNDSTYTHPKLGAVLAYVRGGTILQDLEQEELIELDELGKLKDKYKTALVRWNLVGLGEAGGPCWTDHSLFDAFIGYYAQLRQNEAAALCMVTGEMDLPTDNHPRGIVSSHNKAKLISANDNRGFTYRGRFSQKRQAVTVGYTASQKAHNALRWIIANQGVRAELPGDETIVIEEGEKFRTVYGNRTFLCWNPRGMAIPDPMERMRSLGKRNQNASITELISYRNQLYKTLMGWKGRLPDREDVVLVAFDVTTKESGRLAITYYSELRAKDFLERLCHWDETCCWAHEAFGIQSPSLEQIANFAFGTLRGDEVETDDRILRLQIQRLLHCRIEGALFPEDIERRLVERVADLHLYGDRHLRQNLLFTACAAVQKYHYDHDREKGKWNMTTDLQTRDRSFQFGRLLAVLEYAEQVYYRKAKSERETNAIRMLSVYRQRPWSIYEKLNRKIRAAYLSRIRSDQRRQYEKLTDEIVGLLSEFELQQLDRPLEDVYLLGYHLQRKELLKKKDTDAQTEGENEDEHSADEN